jgi:hypothetical protein
VARPGSTVYNLAKFGANAFWQAAQGQIGSIQPLRPRQRANLVVQAGRGLLSGW